jgi:tetratricopeptide (TPR) repeat protein
MNRRIFLFRAVVVLSALTLLLVSSRLALAAPPVRVWEQDVVIPTYEAGAPEPNPMFYFGRASQGAEGRIYPYPLYDTLTGRKVDKTYRLVTLENEYVKIGILPEIGGRLFGAVDKTNGYNFFYRQHVIKPALIGLIGAWISGGIEWNIPHHHRASTFLPVQYLVRENGDGGKTVWVGELELRHRMRWAVGYTLRPGSSVLEAQVRIVNRTPVANSMLCFANAAVHVNENYQVIFPPNTQYVTHHSKREFTTWPIATGRYGGYDFGQGTDVSWFKNHISANSMFAWNYEDDFFAGYDHGAKAGTMSVADHHLVPGKKLWTWGNGPRGRMWDHILTDSDGPYIELMVGAYSDNQPDYSWLQPYETRWVTMSWYPFREIGGVKCANLDAAVNLDVTDGKATVGFHTTAAHAQATARLTAAGKSVLEVTVAIDPARPLVRQISLPAGVDPHDVRASLSVDGKELVAYAPIRLAPVPKPAPVREPPPPAEIKTTEELYLAGLRIEQFHSPALDPEPYWEEALRRDPGDVRVNTALGLNALKRAKFTVAEAHLRKALERLTAGYTSPKNGEPYYYLGVALKAQGRLDEAVDAFSRSTWAAAWRAAGSQGMAEIASLKGDFSHCLELVDRALEAEARSIRGLNLKAAALRHLGRNDEALRVLERAAREVDPLDTRTMAEHWLVTGHADDGAALLAVMKRNPATALETAAEFQNAGLWDDGLKVLAQVLGPEWLRVSPLVYYDLAYFADHLGRKGNATRYRQLARGMSPESVFPFQAESIEVLRAAIKADPHDARAPYFLGNLLFDWQPEEAVKLWETSVAIDPTLPVVHRNLAIALSHRPRGNDLARAIGHLEKAVSLPDKSPIHFFELDELYEAAGTPLETRLARLVANHEVVARRDDALGREINLRVLMGQYDAAVQLMSGRRFAVWEGGSLSVADDWTDAHLSRGVRELGEGRPREALADFQAAGSVPDNLPSETRDDSARRAEIAFRTGLAHEALSDREKARTSWEEAAAGAPGSRRGGRGGGGDRGTQPYYRALALRKLGRAGPAETILRGMIDGAESSIKAISADIDHAAPFTAQRTERARRAHPHVLAGLGHLGLGETDAARRELTEALHIDPANLPALSVLRELGRPRKEATVKP